MKSLTTIIALLFLITNSLSSQTIVPEGEVAGLWNINESPYIVTGDISIPESGKLTIDPGVKVLFSGQYIFEVNGRLDATGTLEDSIYFGMTDTTGFSTNDYEGWIGIAFMNISGITQEYSLFDFVSVEFSVGNAVTCYNAGLLIQNSKLQYNKGFGMYLVETSDVIIENTQISYNKSGGLMSQNAAPQMSDFVVSYNYGTGISVIGNSFYNDQSIFENGSITNNISESYGGGVLVGMDAHIKMAGISIISNSAVRGGGIYCEMGGIELINSNVSFNVAESGGGLCIDGWSNASINNTLVADNKASQSGGGIWISASNLNINRSTLAYNIAGENSSGIEYGMIENKVNIISNSILWENYPQEINTLDANPEVQYSDVMGGYEGYMVMDADPLFVDAENSDYHLQWNEYPQETGLKSPAIDSGDPLAEYDPDGTVADMGAFYFEQTMVTSMNEKNLACELSIYPNPVQESFTLNSDQDIKEIQVRNISGRLIKGLSKAELNTLINISDLSPGIYLLCVYFENGEVVSEKLIKN